jgi:hypothetical protein
MLFTARCDTSSEVVETEITYCTLESYNVSKVGYDMLESSPVETFQLLCCVDTK